MFSLIYAILHILGWKNPNPPPNPPRPDAPTPSATPSDPCRSCDHSLSGIIHILRKHLYSTKIDLTSKFFTNWVFSSKQKKNLFQDYISAKFSCCSLTFLVHKVEEKMLKKFV